ncbi:MAG: DNA mismatch repair protein MutS, partial [Alphaproteobacteria bacterium]|nr:DNA mismatch repair protein MutS [Alphaproteobacteria bacterium]
ALDHLKQWGTHHPLIDQLERALEDDLPVLARDGGFIKFGYLPKLDELRTLRDQSRQHIARLQAEYSKKSGVSGLKIKHNNVIGYFIEVTATHADKLLKDKESFIHRQTMANAVRFTTVELSDLESRIAEAAGKSLALELEIFASLASEIMAEAEAIAKAAAALAEIDVAAGNAENAVRAGYARPTVDASLAFDIKGGRHPVVETALKKAGDDFIANDCALSKKTSPLPLGGEGQGEGAQAMPAKNNAPTATLPLPSPPPQAGEGTTSLWLLTGPNMAGKSTFLRQNALIALLAQAGCFVPATSAHIGVVDRLFSRVGASDDLARGRSTFMVEMVETATILNQATERSLVILDEIGRGTATFDGLSIAWACLEYLHEHNKCRALFATHYHELTGLTDRLKRLSCHAMKVKEHKGNIVFLHEVGDGTADKSYGIHVARLAGLPPAVVTRAEAVLKTLEGKKSPAKATEDLPLFSAAPIAAPEPQESAVELALKDINPDTLSPKEALDTLYALKSKMQ